MVARLQDGVRVGQGIGQVIEDDGLGQVGLEAVQRISFDRRGQSFTHDCRTHNHTQCIERHFAPIAVGVGQQTRLQHAIVVSSCDDIVQRVAAFNDQ